MRDFEKPPVIGWFLRLFVSIYAVVSMFAGQFPVAFRSTNGRIIVDPSRNAPAVSELRHGQHMTKSFWE
jgi:hypothetical protein